MLLREEFKGYAKYFDRCGVNMWKLDELDKNYKITMITERYEKLGRKNFPVKPTETKTEIIDARHFCCIISGMAFFGDRVTKDYTPLGYTMKAITCKNPTNEIKITRRFKYEYVR